MVSKACILSGVTLYIRKPLETEGQLAYYDNDYNLSDSFQIALYVAM